MLKSTISKSAMQSSTSSVRSSTRPSHVPANIQAAAQLIYFAIQDPSCGEVRDAVESLKLLDHTSKTLDLEKLHHEIIHAFPIAPMLQRNMKNGKKTIVGGAMTLQRCILMGIFVVLLTVASYIISVRSEMSMYQAKCADVMSLFDPKRSNIGAFFNEFNKFAQMVFNKEHIDYCKTMQDKYGNMGIYLARELNKMMGTLKARLSISFAIVTALVSIFSNGVNALICIAAKWMGEFDSVCGESCVSGTSKKTKTKTKTTKKSASPEPSDSDSEDDE